MEIDVSSMILEELQQYSTALNVSVDAAAKAAASSLVRNLKETSPEKTGSYRKGWKSKRITKNASQSVYEVYNATDYQLTHLLEYGHAIKGGTARVKAHPHIGPAEERAANLFSELVERAIEETGS